MSSHKIQKDWKERLKAAVPFGLGQVKPKHFRDMAKVAWKNRAVGKGNVTYADGMLYALGEEGVVGLVEATPAAYKEVSRFSIQKGEFPTWTPPVAQWKNTWAPIARAAAHTGSSSGDQ